MKFKVGDKVQIFDNTLVLFQTATDLSQMSLEAGYLLGEGTIEFVDIFEEQYEINFNGRIGIAKEGDYLLPESIYNSKLYKVLK